MLYKVMFASLTKGGVSPINSKFPTPPTFDPYAAPLRLTMARAANVKATAIYLASKEIATAIQSVEVIANRCWRKNIISEQIYKQIILRPHPSSELVRVLLDAVEASIREEEAHFSEFLEILGRELQPEAYKHVMFQITYHLEEMRERKNLAQCTEDDTQNETNETGVAEMTDPQSVQVSDSNLFAATNNDTGTNSSLSTVRKRKRDGMCAHSSPCKEEQPSVLCEQTTHTGTHGLPGSAVMESLQAACPKEASNISDANFPQSNEVEPVQATADTTPSLLDHSLQQRQEMLRRLQEERFTEYDKLQAEANNQVLTDENECLKRQLEEQSSGLDRARDERKKLEKELSDKQLKVDQLLAERSRRIERHQYDLEQLQNRVAEDEKERNKLEVRRRELEQTIKKIIDNYDSEVSQYRREIEALQEKLDATKAVVDGQSSTIREQQREICRLNSNVIELNDKFEKKCMEFDEFKRDAGALFVFMVVFLILVGGIETLMLIVGLFIFLF